MHKHIVVFSDGTGNSSGKLFKTNVWRLYQALDLADPQDPAQPRQFALYDNGVGTSSFKPLAALGGAFGVGLARNVRELYAFVCRMYEPGDRIYAFGFSRGAFTIRVLTGLIVNQGLVPYDGSEAELQRHVASAYRAYRRNRFDGPGRRTGQAAGTQRARPKTNPFVGPLRSVRDALIDARDRVLGRRPYRDIVKTGAPGSAQPIEVAFLGLWDTVDAYGLPVDELTRAIDRFVWPLTMRDLNLSPQVLRACHALALDDERNAFHPRLWNERPEDGPDPSASVGVPGGNRTTTHVDQERISQVWFAGVHSDVGGGYPDDGLAHVSLQWIMTEAAKHGLRFSPTIRDALFELSDENAPIHDSRHGLAGYYRYNPRRIDKLACSRQVTIERTKVHESVLRRIQAGHDAYAPIALPADFAVVRIDGRIEDPSAEYLGPRGGPAAPLGERRERVWNWVWWRRVAYFATLAATLLLLAMPLWRPAPPGGACSSRLCIVSGAIDLVFSLLPGFVSAWGHSFRSHPGTFLLVAGLVGLGLWAGGRLERAVRDAMRPLWYSALRESPVTRAFAAEPRRAPADRFVQWLRTRRAYQATFRLLTEWLLPVAFLAALFYLVLVAAPSRVMFAAASSLGKVCIGSVGPDAPRDVPPGGSEFTFDTRRLCAPSGVRLQAGGTYRLRIAIPADGVWADRGIPAGPNGVRAQDATWPMRLAVPLRRHLDQPFFKPMARIGSTGSDAYPLDPEPSIVVPRCRPPGRDDPRRLTDCGRPPPESRCDPSDATGARPGDAWLTYETRIVARSSGELFLYVNDAVLDPWRRDAFYCNNTGTARVAIERVVSAGQPAQVAATR